MTPEPVRAPAALVRLASWLLPKEDRDLLLGDLEEVYVSRAIRGRPVWAALTFMFETAHAAIGRRRRRRFEPDSFQRRPLMFAPLETLSQDLRIGVRGLLKRPGFTLAALLTLALGIGANAAVFSVVNGVLLAPLPYRDADRLMIIWSKWRNFDKTWVSDAEILDYKTRMQAFQDVGAWGSRQVNLTGDGDPIRVGAALITPNLLSVLGAEPAIGRGFTDAEALPDTPTVVILSHGLWQQRFGARTDILGQTINVDGVARHIAGVMPAGFQLPTDYVEEAEEPTRLWLPLRLDPSTRSSHSYYAAGRLKPGVTPGAANAELLSLTQTLTAEGKYPQAMQFSAFALTATDEAFGGVRNPILLLMGAVGCLMLIACANVANLLLVRADSRAREMAVRAALGARRSRLIRQMLTESAALAVGAVILGIGLAWMALQLLLSVDLTPIPRSSGIALDGRVLLFSLALTGLTLILFSLPPAVRASRVDLNESIKEGSLSTTAGGRRQRMRGMLVAAETALAVALLSGALLMIQSLWNLQRIDLGLNPEGVLTMRLAVPPAKYDTPEKVIGFYDQLLDRVRELPGVQAAGFVRLLPLASTIGDWGLAVEGYQPPPGTGAPGDWQVVTDGALTALGERLTKGRDISAFDAADGQQVALINEAMAKKYWAGREAIGGRFRQGGPNRPVVTVVGIVGDVKHNGITGAVKPKFYRPHSQFHRSSGNAVRNMALAVRTGEDPAWLTGAIRAEVRRMDADVPIAAIQTMEDIVASSIATPRLTGWLLSLFAGLALLLAAIGIYSVLSYVVSQRRREIGIRVAMGASTAQVVGLIWRGGLLLTVAGAAAGMVIAGLSTRAMTSLLHGVTPLDPAAFVAAPVLLMIVASLAALIPAIRATQVDPVRALRAD
ncbi:MAG: ABC transporter permease [Vicinamibacterales bacterium]